MGVDTDIILLFFFPEIILIIPFKGFHGPMIDFKNPVDQVF